MSDSFAAKQSLLLKKTNYSMVDKVIFFMLSIFFVLKPFYFWSSGLPQIADFLMVILFFIYLLKNGFVLRVNSGAKVILLICLLFIVYVTSINLIWSSIVTESTREFYITSIYYIYNFTILLLLLSLFAEYREKIIEITYKSTLISVIIQFTFYLVSGGYTGGRMTGNFNNPNQLGYYALTSLSILLILSSRIKVKIKWFVTGILASSILVLSSLSKAAIISYVGVVLFFLMSINRHPNFKKKFIVLFAVIIVIFVLLISTTNILENSDLVRSVYSRLASIGSDGDDSFFGRGYSRIIDYPEYLIFGAGEGAYTRFSGSLHGMEFHSTIGNILMSYGIIGLLLFLLFIYRSYANDKQYGWYIILFLMMYGLSHNGIRNSLIWVIFSLLICGPGIKTNNIRARM